jgi:hypothetical protein
VRGKQRQAERRGKRVEYAKERMPVPVSSEIQTAKNRNRGRYRTSVAERMPKQKKKKR